MTYTNPILYGDYSDPDVIRVEDAFYMVSSSFTYLPGIPVLRSYDLVHWHIISYAAARLPFARYDKPVHKCGTWAPSIRWHNGLFYVYVCLPDEGLLAFTASDPAGEWECHYVKDVCGWIDPCPLFDEDGQTYLVHGFAASRCGVNNMLFLHRMSPDGLSVLDKGTLIYYGGHHGDVVVEGPKMYRRNGYYYIMCPAGGVENGYQLALRSASPFGPYERRVVLAQGETVVNGPHQGGWIDTGAGEDYFIHFQDVGVYGRIPHLQPVVWENDWPVMGDHGAPVLSAPMPKTLRMDSGNPNMSDALRDGMSMQWQWQANPNPAWYEQRADALRLFAAEAPTLFEAGSFLSQLMLHRNFTASVSVCREGGKGCKAGLTMMGYTYHYIAVNGCQVQLVRGETREGDRWTPDTVQEHVLAAADCTDSSVLLQMTVRDGAVRFAYGPDAAHTTALGDWCALTNGGWTGARPGIFCLGQEGSGYADFSRFEVVENQ